MAGIYLHIPFCKKLCNYCDFYHILSPDDFDSFINALKSEAEMRKSYLGKEHISTIYFGGGTPSVLPLKDLAGLIDHLTGLFPVQDNCEITVELNPDDITKDYIDELKKIPVNRLSIGVQSFRDQDLKLLNRRHSSAQAEYALNQILEAGFQNVTIDLIYGLPGMETNAWASNLDKAFSFDIKHLSAYHLTIEPETVFGKMKEKGLLAETDEEESIAEFNLLLERSETAGFIPYEISNFGKEGYFSVHNMNYWKQVPYMGLGPSAHSFNGFSRQWNTKDLKGYIKSLKKGNLLFESEDLDFKTRFNEYIMTSLRTMWGLDLDYIERTFEKEGYDYVINLSYKFIGYGLMKHEKNTLVLSNQGKMISDNIISEFLMV